MFKILTDCILLGPKNGYDYSAYRLVSDRTTFVHSFDVDNCTDEMINSMAAKDAERYCIGMDRNVGAKSTMIWRNKCTDTTSKGFIYTAFIFRCPRERN